MPLLRAGGQRAVADHQRQQRTCANERSRVDGKSQSILARAQAEVRDQDKGRVRQIGKKKFDIPKAPMKTMPRKARSLGNTPQVAIAPRRLPDSDAPACPTPVHR